MMYTYTPAAEVIRSMTPLFVMMMSMGMVGPAMGGGVYMAKTTEGERARSAKGQEKEKLPVITADYSKKYVRFVRITPEGQKVADRIIEHGAEWAVLNTQLTKSQTNWLMILGSTPFRDAGLKAGDPGVEALASRLDFAVMERMGYVDVTWEQR